MFDHCSNYVFHLNKIHDSIGKALRTANLGPKFPILIKVKLKHNLMFNRYVGRVPCTTRHCMLKLGFSAFITFHSLKKVTFSKTGKDFKQ
jgi:hypothetical protein